MIRLKECIVCGSDGLRNLYPATFEGGWRDAVPLFLTDRRESRHGDIVQCRNCGFAMTNPQFAPKDYARIYTQLKFGTVNVAGKRGANVRFRLLRKRVLRQVQAGRFLDLGCGDGGFLSVMKEFEGIGFEAGDGDLHCDNNVIVGDFLLYSAVQKKNEPNKFDFITAWDVLEHLPDLDRHMAAIHGLIKTGGIFFCTLPNISSMAARISGRKWNAILLEHLWYFSTATFRRYVQKSGFEVIKLEPIPYTTDIRTLMQRFRQIYGWDIFGMPDIIAERVLHLPAGMMYAVCRKT